MGNWQDHSVRDLSTGITDNRIDGDGYRKAHNLLIANDRTLVTRPGSEPYDSVAPVMSDITGGDSMYTSGDQILLAHNAQLWSSRSTLITPKWLELTRTQDNIYDPSYTSIFNEDQIRTKTSFARLGRWLYATNGDFVRRISGFDTGLLVGRNAGLPQPLTPNNVTIPAGADTITYFLCYRLEFYFPGSTEIDLGPTLMHTISNTVDPGTSPLTMRLYWIHNEEAGLWEKQAWNVDSIKLDVYRMDTTNLIPKLVATLDKPAASTTYHLDWQDNTSYASLESSTNELIYTEGDVLDNDLPPRAFFCTVANQAVWYARDYIHKNRFYQSIQNDGDSVPGSFYNEVDDEITGIGAVGNYPIVFTSNSVWRAEGIRSETGGGSVTVRRISDRHGTISHHSIVPGQQGLYFFSKSGLCFTDGSRVMLVSDKRLKETYKSFLRNYAPAELVSIQGKINRENSRIYWNFRGSSDSVVSDTFLVYDENHSAPSKPAFTTLGGDYRFQCATFDFPSTDSFAHFMIRIGNDGVAYGHRDELTTDETVYDTATGDTYEAPIVYDFETVDTSFGSADYQKEVPYVTFTFKDETSINCQPYENKDLDDNWIELDPISFDNDSWEVGDDDLVVGETESAVNHQGIATARRMANSNYYRCHYKGYKLKNLLHEDYVSDDYDTATYDYFVSDFSITVQLANSTAWPSDIIGSYLYLSNDSYRTAYEITDLDGETVTLRHFQGDTEAISGLSWVIKSYKKNETLKLIGYKVRYRVIGDIDGTYQTGDGVDNGS